MRPRGALITDREVGGGRAPRQPGQVRKEAAATSFRSGRSPVSHPISTAEGRRGGRSPRMSGLFQDDPPPQQASQPGPALFADATPPAPAHAAAYRVLARKYRPAGFADLIGQEAMVRTLRNAFATGR